MGKGKVTRHARGVIPGRDPLGLKGITLGGDAPSLHVEARIAIRQWDAKNSSSVKMKKNDRPEKET